MLNGRTILKPARLKKHAPIHQPISFNVVNSIQQSSNIDNLRKSLWFDAARWFAILPVDTAINKLLERLGTLHDADRAWLVLLNAEQTFVRVTHEWDAKGMPPTLGKQQEQSLFVYRWIYNKCLQGKEVFFNINSIPRRHEAFRKHMAIQGVQTFYGAPIFAMGKHVGLIGYHKVTGIRKWTVAERKETRQAAALLGEWLHAKAYEQPSEKPKEAVAAAGKALFIKTGTISISIPHDNIIYIEAALNYSLVHTVTSKPTVVYRSMGEWEKALPSAQFLRIHRSFIINVTKFSRLNKNAGAWQLTMENDQTIPIGRKYRAQFMEKVKES